MIIFAVDSSASAGSAALWRDGGIVSESYADLGRTHSETLMARCDEVFCKSGITPAQVDYYAVTSGPGSFTGLRIGMGTVKGLAFATGKPCVAVPTLEAMAYNVRGTDRTAVTVLDARRGRVYMAAFDAADNITRLLQDSVVETAQLGDVFRDKKIILIGDAATMCYNKWHEKVNCVVADSEKLMPHASGAAYAAVGYINSGKAVSAAGLVAEYIQLPQAQRELLARAAEDKMR